MRYRKSKTCCHQRPTNPRIAFGNICPYKTYCIDKITRHLMFVHTTSMTTYGGGATLWGFYALGGFGTTSLGSSTAGTRDGTSTGHGYISSEGFFIF